ncbi:MAG: S8 family serine peptidase [Bdellovibrionales bacterium]|nr:S8 family serine peptidase [Bdellovibrionales bacterium]
MRNTAFVVFAVIFTLIGCSKNTPSSRPELVDAARVESILLANSAADSVLCESELIGSGAKVLYRNDNGVLMTDQKPEALRLRACEATVSHNRREALPATDETRTKGDLSTLLKLIPAEEMGARSFISANPGYDGRGITIAVLDTGVELDHPLLKKTTEGKIKIADFQDFSGQGRLELSPVEVDANFIFKSAGGIEYYVKDVDGADYRFGVYAATNIDIPTETFKDMGVITYKKGDKLFGRIDTNHNRVFGDEVELTNYAEAHQVVKLGEGKTLSAAFNILDQGAVATLCFDDGSHGTHVSGIAAGYSEGGLTGVAPGAQVIVGKIGDNRLSGGSTTTASKMLAIDFAVANGAQVINISYGIRAGSDLGKSAIDKYVDKVALEKNVLFSISAGNEGPGVQTIGTPAGADRAITPGAYISKETAHGNYGYVGVERDNMWYFSSVGPRADGGWKPSISAPGSAVSSLPIWAGGHENYRGTSMAAPEVTGALAVLLSAAKDKGLPTDRVSVTQAVYNGAKPIDNLKWIEQGHGLMNIPGALEKLAQVDASLPMEYDISVNSTVAPDGKGKGIFVRSRHTPSNAFTVVVSPVFPAGTPAETKTLFLRTFKLESSAGWVQLPENFWVHSRAPRSFQVKLDLEGKSGLLSEKISAVDEKTGLVAFEIPVTVVRPFILGDDNAYTYKLNQRVAVGETLRTFVDVPAGTTAAQIELRTSGPKVWGQLLDQEGRLVKDFSDPDRDAPQAPIYAHTNITKAGVYEVDISAPANNEKAADIELVVKAYSLAVKVEAPSETGVIDATVQNNFAPLKASASAELREVRSERTLRIEGDVLNFKTAWSAEDAAKYASLDLQFQTAKKFYDLMTDFPYMVFCEDGSLLTSGGLELDSTVSLGGSSCQGERRFQLQGAFAKEAPDAWFVRLVEHRILKMPVVLGSLGRRLLETGQSVLFSIDLNEAQTVRQGQSCAHLVLLDGEGREIQATPVCE